jgi:hypothetical protein
LVLSTKSKPALRIVVLGYIVRGPLGGVAWHHLQYVLGLRSLGHEVLFLEDSDDYPSCYNPTTYQVGTDPSYGIHFAQRAFERLNLADAWAYYDRHLDSWHGPASSRAIDFCGHADLLVNVSAVNPLRDWTMGVPVRVLIDTDPVFTQVRHLTDEAARARANCHNVFLTFGELFGFAGCAIPADGFPWIPTRQPIVLDAWPVARPPANARFTTVMQWESYPSVQYNGQRFGTKKDSFAEFQALPNQVEADLEIALGSNSAPRKELQQSGWRLADPLAVTRDPWTYQEYLQGSLGEFSVAKQGYVVSHSGWFSDRSACYLASGRPVVTQDTWFSHLLPSGAGLHAFHNCESAVAAIERVISAPRREAASAREIAMEFFDARKVLSNLIDQATPTPLTNEPCEVASAVVEKRV